MHQQTGHANSSHSPTGSSPCCLTATPTPALPLTTCLSPHTRLQNPTAAAQIPLPDSCHLPTLLPARRLRLTFMLWRGVGSCPLTWIHMPFSMLMLAYGRGTSRAVPSPLERAHDPWRVMIALWQRVKAPVSFVHLPVSLFVTSARLNSLQSSTKAVFENYAPHVPLFHIAVFTSAGFNYLAAA